MRLQGLRDGLLAGCAAIGVAAMPAGPAAAQFSKRAGEYSYNEVQPRRPTYSEPFELLPVFAVVSLNEQRISVYGSNGRILQSPVSSGATGYETPSGIFSIVQKKPEHHSNLYDDASMPFMQRITWTGIALHAGALPGYPASHGCVRLPISFAQQLFDVTKLGMRVILTRDDIVPQPFEHPALFKARPLESSLAPVRAPVVRASLRGELPISRLGNLAFENVLTPSPTAERHLGQLSAIAKARSAELQPLARKATEARQMAQRRAGEAQAAQRALKGAESNLARSEDGFKAAIKSLEKISADPKAKPEAITASEAALQKAEQRVADARAELEKARQQNDAKAEAAERAAEEARSAEIAKDKANDDAEEAVRMLSPVSVLVSRKMRRFYVRQANLPVTEGPIDIRDPEKTIGSFVYTALDFKDEGAREMRWSVVSMYRDIAAMPTVAPPAVKPNDKPPTTPVRRTGLSVAADVEGARAALERVSLPAELVERVSGLMVPGSSLIISDEAPNLETGKDTDFIVVMSNEPQGALKIRQPQPKRDRDWDGPSGGFFSFWN
ncbi:MAG: L,D-transpeptidase family protein [Hyphomicrobiaceae bacterium]|nr:L,D-transpeptidase family protein [Hyphomicrobiaceae bacterium]